MSKNLVIYDFDWSLADKDTDEHVLSKYFSEKKSNEENQVWVDFMSAQIRELSLKGITQENIKEDFNDFPISLHMVEAIRLAKSAGNDLFIVSDGNSLFLNFALSKYELTDNFTEIITNQFVLTETNTFELKPAMPIGSHNCCTKAEFVGLTCAPNLCKGIKVAELKGRAHYNKTIYIGDGTNDFCAACQLDSSDLVMVRKGRALESIMKLDSHQVKAEVQYWSDAEEVLERFKQEFITNN